MRSKEIGYHNQLTIIGNDLFMSEDIRDRILGRISILTIGLNTLVGLISYFEMSQAIYLYQLLVTLVAGAVSFVFRKKHPNFSMILISTAFIFGVCFYLVNSAFNRVAILNLFPLISLCVYFLLGRIAALFYSMLFAVLAYFVTKAESFYVANNTLTEVIIYFTVLAVCFSLVYYIRLQVIQYEQRVYNTEENRKLQDLSSHHKKQISSLIHNIREELDDEFQQKLEAQEPEAYEIFMRSFDRIENAIDEIHRLGKRNQLISNEKVYDIWQPEDQ